MAPTEQTPATADNVQKGRVSIIRISRLLLVFLFVVAVSAASSVAHCSLEQSRQRRGHESRVRLRKRDCDGLSEGAVGEDEGFFRRNGRRTATSPAKPSAAHSSPSTRANAPYDATSVSATTRSSASPLSMCNGDTMPRTAGAWRLSASRRPNLKFLPLEIHLTVRSKHTKIDRFVSSPNICKQMNGSRQLS